MTEYQIERVLRDSEKVNLDGLLTSLLYLNDLKEFERNLLKAYFIVSQWVAEDENHVGEDAQNALFTLRDLIESLQDADKPEQAKIRLVAKQ